MIVGVPKESFPGERRVALVPAVIPNLVKSGLEVVVEAGAGVEAGYPDAEYTAKGAKILPERAEVFRAADLVVQVHLHGERAGRQPEMPHHDVDTVSGAHMFRQLFRQIH